jgi:preprotein translocase SecE subunit
MATQSSIKSKIVKVLRVIFAFTLIPYAISTYKELKTVSWMNYWQVVRVTLLVVLFAIIVATIAYGLDQIFSRLFDVILNKI